MKRLRIYQDKRFRDHPAGDSHVESADRLRAVEAAIFESTVLKDAEFSDAVNVDRKYLNLVHKAEYLDQLKQLCDSSARIESAEIDVAPKSWNAAMLAAGASSDAVLSLLANEIDVGFVAPRPPGHHAESQKSLGFCLINNAAVAAVTALENGIKRVAILDWDLHHGNGTQEIFWNDPRVLFMSFHQRNLYPKISGNEDETGGPNAPGLTINRPLEPETGDECIAGLFDHTLTPAITAFKPELLIISAGFDGHRDDLLGKLTFTENGYIDMTRRVLQWGNTLGCGIVSILEGGYALTPLALCTVAHCETLLKGA